MEQDKPQEIKLSYYLTNRDKMAKKIICETCGGIYSMVSKSHHNRTKKHNYWIERNKQKENPQVEQPPQE